MSNPFAAPASATGVEWETLNGALLLIEPKRIEAGVNTAFGEKDPLVADITVLDGDSKGEVFAEAFVFPTVLISQLRPNIGGKVLGRLGQGNPKPGQKPPWKLLEATEDDVKVGTAYLAGQVSAPADDVPF